MKDEKRITVSVTNDLTTDQRVDRVCRTLKKMGFDVLLVGRKLSNSLPLAERPYRMKRMKLFFRKGAQFYAEYNLRLFFFLLFHRTDVLLSNDLDTLLANYLAWKMKNRKVQHVHDCHEYFRGVPELNGRPGTVKAWKRIEDQIFPKLKNIYAVNHSIAEIYKKEYSVDVKVIRNVPYRKENIRIRPKSDLGIPEEHKIILYQGAVNIDRGLEEVIQAMRLLETKATLLIAGIGDVYDVLKMKVIKEGLEDRVLFTGQIPLEILHETTAMADIGLSIEKDVSLNYHFSLPNKFLDYIQANVPVLISPFPEMTAIVDKYMIGRVIRSHDPKELAMEIDAMLSDVNSLEMYRKNLQKAAVDLCWENEEKKLMEIFQAYV